LIGTKELLIDDLGYFKQEAMMNMSEKGAYFLSRYSHRTGIYTKTEELKLLHFDIVDKLKKAVLNEIALCDFEVWFSKDDRQLKVRMIAEKMP
jgi:hypothetical protein